MQKLLFVMLLGGLVVAKASSQPVLSGFEKSFKALDDYLVENVRDNDNAADNLAHIKSNIDQLTGAVKVAGQVVLDLHEPGDQCNNKVLSALLAVPNPYFSSSRIQNVISVERTEAYRVCSKHILQSYKQASPRWTKFFQNFGPYGIPNHNGVMYRDLYDSDIFHNLRALAQDDSEYKFWYRSKSDQSLPIKIYAKFDRAFEELLVKPCRLVLSDDHLLEMMPALTLAQAHLQRDDHGDAGMRQQLKNMNWTRSSCRRIINMDSSDKDYIFSSY